MEGNELVEAIASKIMAEAEYNAFEDYMRKFKRSGGGMDEYAEKMRVMSMTPSVMFSGNWQVSIELPYKSPIGKNGFEYSKSRRVNYEKGESGLYVVAGSYGIDRKTSSMDKMITNAVLGFCHDHDVQKVIITREKI